jgi:hypothetical protein
MSGDDDAGCSVRALPAHRPHSLLELAVVGLDRVVRILLDVIPRRGQQLIKGRGVDRGGVGDHLGTLLFTTGGGAINPYAMLATANAAQAALRNWVLNLNGALADKGIHAANLAINLFIGANPPATGIPHADPDDIAQVYWNLHTSRRQAEHLVAR